MFDEDIRQSFFYNLLNVLEMTIKFEKISPENLQINRTSWMRNQLTKLHIAVSTPVAATRDALTERL